MTTIGYVRVSVKKTVDTALSIDQQTAAIQGYCRLHGMADPEIIVDEGYSGKDLRRPGMQAVLDRVDERTVDHVIVAKLDRLSRSVGDTAELIGQRLNGHTGLHSVTEKIDTSSAMGEAIVHIMATMAQLERGLRSEDMVRQHEHARRTRGRAGVTPFGYRLSSNGKTLQRCKRQWPIVQRIRDLRAEGMAYNKIAREMNDDEIPTPRGGRWYTESVRQICTRKYDA